MTDLDRLVSKWAQSFFLSIHLNN